MRVAQSHSQAHLDPLFLNRTQVYNGTNWKSRARLRRVWNFGLGYRQRNPEWLPLQGHLLESLGAGEQAVDEGDGSMA